MKDTAVFDAKNERSFDICAQIIKEGGLVAFPTETVYGLGANGFIPEAVKSIFEAKGRPSDNPLILHVASIEQAESLYSEIPDSFYKIVEVFWPGPLTVICKKSRLVPDEVSAGLETVAVRMPANDCALELIKRSGVPIAAPSANRSGKPSPTNASHVYNDMCGRIDALLCGDVCKYGVESTVISLVNEPTILRPGAVTPKMLSAVLGGVKLASSILEPVKDGEKVLSPGMKYKHYSPDARVFAFTGKLDEIAEKINVAYDKNVDKKCIILSSEENCKSYGNRAVSVIGSRQYPETMCASLFSAFREYNDYDMIFCEALPADEVGLAYMNRLLRACGFMIS